MDATDILAIAIGLFLTFVGCNLTFRQAAVRRLIRRPAPLRSPGEDEDALAYALRISGVMIMAFGIIITGMFIAFHLMS